jgi:hypothetical protein
MAFRPKSETWTHGRRHYIPRCSEKITGAMADLRIAKGASENDNGRAQKPSAGTTSDSPKVN